MKAALAVVLFFSILAALLISAIIGDSNFVVRDLWIVGAVGSLLVLLPLMASLAREDQRQDVRAKVKAIEQIHREADRRNLEADRRGYQAALRRRFK